MHKPRSTPAETESLTCDLVVPYFGIGTPEECLAFRTDFDKVCVGQNVTTGPGQCSLARRSLTGEALTMFDNHAAASNQESVPNCQKCLDAVRDSVFPHRAAAMQKQCMRQFLKKPENVKTRKWLARAFELNKHLPRFPPSGDPPVQVTKLDNNEIKDIAECGVPHRWAAQLRLQNFNVGEKTIGQFINFCERFESVEGTEGSKDGPKPNDKQTSRAKKRGRTDDHNGRDKSDVECHCMLHGENDNHDSNKCKKLLALAKQEKEECAQKRRAKFNPKAKTSKEECNAIAKQVVKIFTKKTKKNNQKNQKTDTEESNAIGNVALSDFDDSKMSDDSENSDGSSVTSE